MEIEAKLESIENKIESYNEKIDNISSLITTLIHSFQQNQLPKVKAEILAKIEEKFSDNSSLPDVEEMKTIFTQIKDDFTESQSGLKLKIIELEKSIKKATTSISNTKISKQTATNDESQEKLNNIEEILNSIQRQINTFNNVSENVQTAEFPTEKIDAITTLISTQHDANKGLLKNLENHIKSLEANVTYLNNSENAKEITSNINVPGIDEIKTRFDELNLSITSVLSAIKIIDKKYNELKSFQEVIDKLTTDVVSPILLASNDIKAFVEKTSNNFNAINDFVKEYNKEAFTELQNKIQNVNENVDKLYIDVNRLYDLVDEFKTNTDLSNHTISDNMAKIENMITEYSDSLTELTQNATAEVIKDGVKSLNDEFYLELLNLFNSLSFDNEAEDIKDFIENVLSSITVKTDENSEKLNSIMMQFKNLLHKVEGIEKAQNSISDYLKPEETDELMYSFEDIQTDLAKMRLVLNDISKSINSSGVVDEISAKIKQTGEQIENFSKILNSTNENDENVAELKEKLENLNSQVYEISVRTNKLILSNEDSNIELKNNLELFKDVFDKANPQKLYELFYELTNYFNDVNEKISNAIQIVNASHNETLTIKNALIYVGEWLDNATNVLEDIRTDADKINSITPYPNITNQSHNLDNIGIQLNDIKEAISRLNIISQLDEITSNTVNIINGRNENAILLKEINNLQKSIDGKIANINNSQIDNNQLNDRINNIESKLDTLIELVSKQKNSSNKTSTTQLKNLDKRISSVEEILNAISEKLLKE